MASILIGAGQVGGIIGGRLVRAGHDLTFCDIDGEQVQAIRTDGLRADLPEDSFTVRPKIIFPNELSGKYDLVLIAVRSEGTKDVLNSLSDHLTDDTLVIFVSLLVRNSGSHDH
ncbi:MAG: ketopantoate reductase family protein [Candidatus Binatia bacterium]